MSTKKLLLVAGAVAALALAGTAWKLTHRAPAQSATADASANPASADGPRVATPLQVVATVYDGKLAAGWTDWGWGRHELNKGEPAKVVFANYGGIIFRHMPVEANFGAIAFRYKAPPGPEFLTLALKSANVDPDRLPKITILEHHVAPLDGGWREVLVPLAELNPSGFPFDRIVISAGLSVGADWVLIDKVQLTQGGHDASHARNVQLVVLCREPTHEIDPMIYGAAQGDWASGFSAQRLGGNPTTRFNWDLLAWNSANDWFFENTKSIDLKAFLAAGLEHEAQTALTVPIIGWVAKDQASVGYPKAQFPKQRKFDQYRPEAGDGHQADGLVIAPGPATQTSIPAPPELIGRWVSNLVKLDRARGKRSAQMYILDNEPSLWDTTHHDVHPDPLGYDELLERTLRYAAEVRKADPGALIAGPAEWGWMGYLYSARDRVAGKGERPDRRAHGDMPLIPWYLRQIAQYEKSTNAHVLDYLDVHFYPAADGLYGGSARTDADAAALRIRSTRGLWDPSYEDESWIKEPIRLIPRLKEWVQNYRPGLRVSLGEWSFGADEHISGGLATAEALGRFGQHGLDAAFFWDGPKANSAAFWAFRAFRNYDGAGARFLDSSLNTREAGQVSIFASRNRDLSKLVAVLLNRDPQTSAAVTINLDGCATAVSQRVFRFEAGSKELASQPAGKLDGQRVFATLPPYSLSVIEVSTDPAKR